MEQKMEEKNLINKKVHFATFDYSTSYFVILLSLNVDSLIVENGSHIYVFLLFFLIFFCFVLLDPLFDLV